MKLEDLSSSVNIDTKQLLQLLSKFDYETIKEQFETVYNVQDKKHFDFENGLLCGTIENKSGRPALVDLQFTQRHLI